jgi:hypothetical protein
MVSPQKLNNLCESLYKEIKQMDEQLDWKLDYPLNQTERMDASLGWELSDHLSQVDDIKHIGKMTPIVLDELLAFACGKHYRCGFNSPIQNISNYLLQNIIQMVRHLYLSEMVSDFFDRKYKNAFIEGMSLMNITPISTYIKRLNAYRSGSKDTFLNQPIHIICGPLFSFCTNPCHPNDKCDYFCHHNNAMPTTIGQIPPWIDIDHHVWDGWDDDCIEANYYLGEP